jgi:hypothetical protein
VHARPLLNFQTLSERARAAQPESLAAVGPRIDRDDRDRRHVPELLEEVVVLPRWVLQARCTIALSSPSMGCSQR